MINQMTLVNIVPGNSLLLDGTKHFLASAPLLSMQNLGTHLRDTWIYRINEFDNDNDTGYFGQVSMH